MIWSGWRIKPDCCFGTKGRRSGRFRSSPRIEEFEDDVFIKFLNRHGGLTIGCGLPNKTGPELEVLPASWTIIGARWGNIGLAKASERVGQEGKPFVVRMKRIRPNLAARCVRKDRQLATLQKALDTLEEALKSYEDPVGEVAVE